MDAQQPVDRHAEIRRHGSIVADDPLAGFSGWRKRVAGFVWRFLGPSLQRQQEHNALIVHYVDATALDIRREMSERLSSLADEIAKRWESMVAREQRYEARAANQAKAAGDMRAAIASLEQSIGPLQRLSHTLERELERLMAAGMAPAATAGNAPAVPVPPSLDGWKYVSFEDQFRGPADQVRANLSDYLPRFQGASDVVDIGCGRGEFLQLLKEHAISGRGVDLNHEMVEACRLEGLDVAEGDGVDYLASLPDGSIGGLFAAQVIEHLPADRILRLLDFAFAKLRPGAPIVLETINPACWAAFFESYIRDLTHVRPVHPETLKYLMQASGFQKVEIRFSAPYPDHARLQPVVVPASLGLDQWVVRDIADAFNENVKKLNALLFTYFDYAAIGQRA